MDSDDMASCEAVNDCVEQIERNELARAELSKDDALTHTDSSSEPQIEVGESIEVEGITEIPICEETSQSKLEVSPVQHESSQEAPGASNPTSSRKIECFKCQSEESSYWRTTDDGTLLCVHCMGAKQLEAGDPVEDESQAGSDSPASVENEEIDEHPERDVSPTQKAPSPRKREVRKATRMKTAKSVKSVVKSRRTMTFKKIAPAKTTPAIAHFITSNYVRHKGSYLQTGDIVSMLGDDDEIYYAQLRTFLVDQFGELSATITWLLPTERSPSDDRFDPATYIIGPEEDFPRDLRSMSFECHAPSDYYLAKDRPVLFDSRKGCKGFIWTTLGKRPKAIQE